MHCIKLSKTKIFTFVKHARGSCQRPPVWLLTNFASASGTLRAPFSMDDTKSFLDPLSLKLQWSLKLTLFSPGIIPLGAPSNSTARQLYGVQKYNDRLKPPPPER